MRAPILALKDVRLADGPLMLFDGVDLALDARVRACLVGRNGAGKSTLLRILAGEILPDGGERNMTTGTRIAFVPQEPAIVGATLLENATAGGAPDYLAEAALTVFDLDPGKAATGLSGGEIRRFKQRLDVTVRNLITEGIADGSVKPCHPGMFSALLFGALNWVPHWHREGGKFSIEDVADNFMDTLTQGIATRRA